MSLPLKQIVCKPINDFLPTLPSESVDFIMTSPPYWGLRSYESVCAKIFDYTEEGYRAGEAWVTERHSYFTENYRHVRY